VAVEDAAVWFWETLWIANCADMRENASMADGFFSFRKLVSTSIIKTIYVIGMLIHYYTRWPAGDIRMVPRTR